MKLFKNGSKIAVVGYSEAPHRIVVKVTNYLLEEGNTIIGINPNIEKASKTDILVLPSLEALTEPMDIIQVFRKSSALPELGREIENLSWKPKLIWCQQGVIDLIFQEEMERRGIQVVMDACPYALRSFL
ncbi:MAG: CoA-binding protein [Acidobacteriota bacterium]|nr:CoA-binding protein [Acidobacteriota bacterium]